MREDKRQWTQEKAEMAEKAAKNGRSKKLYRIVKQLTGQGMTMRQVAAVKRKAGELLKNKKARQER